MFLDGNFTALKNRIDLIKRIIKMQKKYKLKISFTQGFDIRLIDEEFSNYVCQINHDKAIYIAYDEMKNKSIIENNIKYLTRHFKDFRKIMCYVLIGYNTTKEEDYYRVMKLVELGVSPFVMSYNKFETYQRNFARWVNHKAIFRSVKWENYKC